MTPSPVSGSTSVARFIAWQRDFNQVSSDRLTRQEGVLVALSTAIGAPPEQATAPQFAAYLEALSASGLAANTVRSRANMARPFFKWAWREGLITAEASMRLADVPNPAGSSGASVPNPYARREIARMWRDLDTTFPRTTDPMIQRWRRGTSKWPRVWRHAAGLQAEAILMLALHGGMRRDEIFRSEIDDIHPDSDYLVVYGAAKGYSGGDYRMREVPMTVEARRALMAWFEFRSWIRPQHTRPWLTLNPRAHPGSTIPAVLFDPMSARSLQRMAGEIGSGYQLQRLRHTCATEWLRAGMELEQVSRLLGHASLQQTLAYAKIAPDDIARSARKAETTFTQHTTRKAVA